MAYKRKTTDQKLHRRARIAVKSAVVPHKRNDYRPHLIRWYGIASIVFVALLWQGGYNFMQSGSVLGAATNIDTSELLTATNEQRTAYNEHPLQSNARLNKAAALKADDMFAKQYWAHNAPDGTTPWEWFQQAGYDYHEAGENLAKGFHTSDSVVAAWMASQEHRDNILGVDYTQVGFAIKDGVLNGHETTLVVALYGDPVAPVSIARSNASLPSVLAATDGNLSFIERVGIGFQSMTPALLGSIILFAIAIAIAFVAHAYRKRLPNSVRTSWMRHHGLYKALGLASLVVVCVGLYGGGQI